MLGKNVFWLRAIAPANRSTAYAGCVGIVRMGRLRPVRGDVGDASNVSMQRQVGWALRLLVVTIVVVTTNAAGGFRHKWIEVTDRIKARLILGIVGVSAGSEEPAIVVHKLNVPTAPDKGTK